MLPTERTNPIYKMDKYNWLIYGQEGIGKSTFANQFDKALFIPTEPGLDSLPVFKATEKECIESWEEFGLIKNSIVEAVKAKTFDYDIVVIDTLDRLADLCMDYVCHRENMAHPSDQEWGKGWNLVSKEFRRVVSQLFPVVKVMFISHEKQTPMKEKAVSFNKISPSVTGGIGKYINETVGIIGYITTDPEETGKRVVQFRGNKYLVAKDHTDRLGELCEFDFHVIKERMEGGENSKSE